ncbi:MAG TPA: UPF0158 family protein [Pyrinomonadaceae bacterium]|nr:UPF0158 family protein [Pyrinomonadaceae bacterium]
MSATVNLIDVVDALDNAMEEQAYYLDKRTGEIILLTSEDLEAAEEDEPLSDYPDWQRESIQKAREVLNESNAESFAQFPDKFDVDHYRMMEEFSLSLENRQVGEELLRLIKGKGAFGRFKNGIYSMGVEKAWYEFKRSELEKIGIHWLESQGISYKPDDVVDV